MQLRPSGCHIRRGLSFLLVLLVCGCEGRDPASNSPSPRAEANPPKLNSAAENPSPYESSTDTGLPRTNQLTAELAAMEAEKAQLLQRREELHARLTHHQERSTALLADLRAEMQEAARKGDDQAFKVAARTKVEAALSQDDELTDAMNDLDAQIAQIDKRTAELTAQLEAVGQEEIAQSAR